MTLKEKLLSAEIELEKLVGEPLTDSSATSYIDLRLYIMTIKQEIKTIEDKKKSPEEASNLTWIPFTVVGDGCLNCVFYSIDDGHIHCSAEISDPDGGEDLMGNGWIEEIYNTVSDMKMPTCDFFIKDTT